MQNVDEIAEMKLLIKLLNFFFKSKDFDSSTLRILHLQWEYTCLCEYLKGTSTYFTTTTAYVNWKKKWLQNKLFLML